MKWNNDILKIVSENAKVSEGIEGVRNVILWLYRDKKVNNKTLSQLTEIPVPTLSAIRGELIKERILEDKVSFTRLGKKFVEEILGIKINPFPLIDEQIEKLKISSFPNYILRKEKVLKLEQIIKNRPDPDVKIDQSRSTFLTQLKRTALLAKNGDIEGRRILFIGDDDATSLLVSATNLAKKITVLDIDERILTFIKNSIPQIEGNEINLIHHDLREPLPDSMVSSYDIVFTDPPYTYQGGKLFFQRSIYALKEIGNKIYFSFGPKEPEILWNLQLYFLNSGFQLWQIYRSFNKYLGNLRLGQHSNMFVLKMVVKEKFKSLKYEEKIYTSEVKKQRHELHLLNNSNEILLDRKSIGYHLISEFYEIQNPIMLKPTKFYNFALETCENSNLSIIDSYIHIYPPHGLSIIIVLKESHIGIHTWPEHNYVSIDVFICDNAVKAHDFVEILRGKLKPNKVETIKIDRGITSP